MAAKRSAKKSKAAKRTSSPKKSARKAPASKSRKKPAKATRARAARKAAPARRAAARKPAPKKVVPRKRPRPLNVNVVQSSESGPPPPPEDAVEVSGVWGRVLYSENDPYAEARELFNHYDRNKSGQIEASEFNRICEALGMEMDDLQQRIGLEIVDSDHDGKIGWDEFLDWWKSTRT